MSKKDAKEQCPKCQKFDYAIAQDKSNKHYCQTKGCMNVWVPGLENFKRPDLVLKQAQVENQNLIHEITKLRAEVLVLKQKLNAGSETGNPNDEIEMFS